MLATEDELVEAAAEEWGLGCGVRPESEAQIVRCMSEGCVVKEADQECVMLDQVEKEEVEPENAGVKEIQRERSTASQHSEPRSRPRSDSSENNCIVEMAIPCCRQRKCVCPMKCPPGTVRACLDPCCCNPCVPTAVVDNVKLKEENRALRNCIQRVRACAVSDACEIIKGVLTGCRCSCCKARKKLRPCKSVTSAPCRETWLCVPMPGSKRCGGYTPSGWGKLLKRCRQVTTEPCAPCAITSCVTPCTNLRYKCLPPTRPCPPCPHLCPMRSLPAGLRPYTPCCPMYFPTSLCCHGNMSPAACRSIHTDKCQVPCKAYDPCSSCKAYDPCSSCKISAITAPPYRPKYTPMSAICNEIPQASASSPGTLPKVESLLKEDPVATSNNQTPLLSPTKKDSPTHGSYSR